MAQYIPIEANDSTEVIIVPSISLPKKEINTPKKDGNAIIISLRKNIPSTLRITEKSSLIFICHLNIFV